MFTSCNLQLTNKAKLKRRDLYNQFLVHVCYHFGKFKLSSPKEVLERWKTEVGIEFLKALLLNASRWLNPKRFFLIFKTFLSEIFKLSFAECWMESRKNIMKMCHEHTILIFNFTQHSSGLFCVSVCLRALKYKHISFIHFPCSRCCLYSIVFVSDVGTIKGWTQIEKTLMCSNLIMLQLPLAATWHEILSFRIISKQSSRLPQPLVAEFKLSHTLAYLCE